MVCENWFQEIFLVYLPVGHTHEKVDKYLFAPIGNKKKTENCLVPDEFTKMVKKAFVTTALRPAITSNLLVFDWKSFFDPQLREMRLFKNFRAFKFLVNRANEPVFFYKASILDANWLGFEKSEVQGIYFHSSQTHNGKEFLSSKRFQMDFQSRFFHTRWRQKNW